MNEDLKSTLVKCAVMLVVVAAEYWAMQPYNEPIMPRVWQFLARLCYKLAYRLGTLGLRCEHEYYEAI